MHSYTRRISPRLPNKVQKTDKVKNRLTKPRVVKVGQISDKASPGFSRQTDATSTQDMTEASKKNTLAKFQRNIHAAFGIKLGPLWGSAVLFLVGTRQHVCAKQRGLYHYAVARTLSFHPRDQRSLRHVLMHSRAHTIWQDCAFLHKTHIPRLRSWNAAPQSQNVDPLAA